MKLYNAWTSLNNLDRQSGQGGILDTNKRDLRAQVIEAEAAHFSKTQISSTGSTSESEPGPKRQIEASIELSDNGDDIDAKRRKILEETRDIDADSGESEQESSDEERSPSSVQKVEGLAKIV